MGFSRWRREVSWRTELPSSQPENVSSFLRTYFENHKEGLGIFKWLHYFDIYERHLSRFRGTEVNVLEIGVFSGGSLAMWRDYFGEKSRIYGVDIDPACKKYEADRVKISIGDQADRKFWQEFRTETPALDVIIDDGGHRASQQSVSFEELFPFLRHGGVYVCEDLHDMFNGFVMYLLGFAQNLNAKIEVRDGNERAMALISKATRFQSAVGSVHFYPYVAVVERTNAPFNELVAAMHGTRWSETSL